MPVAVFRDDVRRLVGGENAQLVEVLPPEEYEDEQLPGVSNIPLKKLNGTTTAMLKRDAPIIVYCHDYQ